jgi:myo-inositol-1(or 4)-monophosphatase
MSSMQKFIESCLIDAAAAAEKAKAAGLKIKAKGRNDMATSGDLASESLIVGRIRKEFPGSVVLSEESYLGSDMQSDSLFVIDPIDGTHNFIAGIPLYGVSIAHYSGGRPQAGGFYCTQQKQLFYAEKGRHATRNGKRIAVSKTSRLEDFFLLCDSRIHRIEDMGYLPALVHMERISQHTRFLGTAIYEMGYVACGMADANLDFKLKPYDFAASAFVIEQAGGRVTDFEGRPWSLSTTTFIGSNGRQHERIVEIMRSMRSRNSR